MGGGTSRAEGESGSLSYDIFIAAPMSGGPSQSFSYEKSRAGLPSIKVYEYDAFDDIVTRMRNDGQAIFG